MHQIWLICISDKISLFKGGYKKTKDQKLKGMRLFKDGSNDNTGYR